MHIIKIKIQYLTKNIQLGIYCHQNGTNTLDHEIIKKHWIIIDEAFKIIGVRNEVISSDGDPKVRKAVIDSSTTQVSLTQISNK